jgi:hypothetical protein
MAPTVAGPLPHPPLRMGFGDLPDGLTWLRPFGITGAVTLDHPMTGSSINFGIDPLTGQLGPMLKRNVDTLHWAFALEFSTLYLTSRFTPGKLPKDEPLARALLRLCDAGTDRVSSLLALEIPLRKGPAANPCGITGVDLADER